MIATARWCIWTCTLDHGSWDHGPSTHPIHHHASALVVQELLLVVLAMLQRCTFCRPLQVQRMCYADTVSTTEIIPSISWMRGVYW